MQTQLSPAHWKPKRNQRAPPNPKQMPITNVDLSSVDQVLAHSFHGESQFYIFEDNEAVIKMIIKGKGPTMRHVSRTHRVALDWLFDRINLDPDNPNQICRHQKPNGRHVKKKEVSRVTNGTIFCICLTS